ncbi:hypothetical protein EV714DRAFT_255714 [Schizophyllum commune]
MRHIAFILEASVPVFSLQICANFRKRYVDFRVDNHHYLATMFALCPAIKDSIWHVNIERNKPRTRSYREEELELARLLDACTSVRGLSINLCIQGWTEGLLYEEQRQAILRAMQRPTLEYLALFRVRLQEEDEVAFRSLALPASLRVVKLCGVSVFGIHPNKAAGPAAPATPSPSLDSLIVDERSLGFVRLMNLASCQSLTRLDFTSADKHVNDNHVVAQLLRANAQLQHLILRNDYHAEFPVYDLSHNSALRSVIVLFQRSAPLVIENIARALCSIPETVALETFTLCFPPERGEIGMQDSRHWRTPFCARGVKRRAWLSCVYGSTRTAGSPRLPRSTFVARSGIFFRGWTSAVSLKLLLEDLHVSA